MTSWAEAIWKIQHSQRQNNKCLLPFHALDQLLWLTKYVKCVTGIRQYSLRSDRYSFFNCSARPALLQECFCKVTAKFTCNHIIGVKTAIQPRTRAFIVKFRPPTLPKQFTWKFNESNSWMQRWRRHQPSQLLPTSRPSLQRCCSGNRLSCLAL